MIASSTYLGRRYILLKQDNAAKYKVLGPIACQVGEAERVLLEVHVADAENWVGQRSNGVSSM
jgi:hypothetical protein